jgi:hypothetical protein
MTRRPVLPAMCGIGVLPLLLTLLAVPDLGAQTRRTAVSIVGDQFRVNGAPTYQGRVWTTSGGSHRIEGLLMNARLVQVSSTISIRRRAGSGRIQTRDAGIPIATPRNSCRRWRRGGRMAC